jgi:hypothetical protein
MEIKKYPPPWLSSVGNFFGGELTGFRYSWLLNGVGLGLTCVFCLLTLVTIVLAVVLNFFDIKEIKSAISSGWFITIAVLYISGFGVSILLVLPRFFAHLLKYNSLDQQNMRLVLTRTTIMNPFTEYTEPVPVSFENAARELCRGFVVALISALLFSWINVIFVVIYYLSTLWGFFLAPSLVRAHWWRMKNVKFFRAEDVVLSAQDAGLVSRSNALYEKTIEDLSQKSETLTRLYAGIVFWKKDKPTRLKLAKEMNVAGEEQGEVPDEDQELDEEIAEIEFARRYLEKAKQITECQFKSRVIHPSFWAISQDELHAKIAVGGLFDD